MSADETLLQWIRARDALNDLAHRLVGFHALDGAELIVPVFRDPELDFLRSVSWLYKHYFEAGDPSIKFLIGMLDSYDLDADRNLRSHPQTVRDLRTEHQHALSFQSESDLIVRNRCAKWYLAACGTRQPDNVTQWRLCLVRLLDDGLAFMRCISAALRAMERDDALLTHLESWKHRKLRTHRAHEFDPIISEVARDIGRDLLDVAAFRNRYIDAWNAQLRLLEPTYYFPLECRKLVETTMTRDAPAALPITGTDVIQELGIVPGRKVGEILRLAHSIYERKPCSKNELLQQLRVIQATVDTKLV